MSGMLIDTHCHLTYPGLIESADQIVADSLASGVTRIITIGTHPEDHHAAIALADRYPEVFLALGIHPHHAAEVPPDYLPPMKHLLATHPKVLAVGECGLDYCRNSVPHDLQKKNFEEHIALAHELKLPMILHIRDAHADGLAIMKNHTDLHCVVHCFTGTPAECRAWLDLSPNVYIGITGVVTYKNAPDVRQDAQLIPPARLLVETDAPYLSPEPVRKIKINRPSHTVHTAKFVAALRGVSYETLRDQTTANAERLFGHKLTK